MSVTDADVNREFSRFGRLCKVQINRANKCAFVLFDRVEDAVQAAANMRGRVLGSAAWKLKVDFADRSQIRSHSPGPGRQFGRFGTNKVVSSRLGEGSGAAVLVRQDIQDAPTEETQRAPAGLVVPSIVKEETQAAPSTQQVGLTWQQCTNQSVHEASKLEGRMPSGVGDGDDADVDVGSKRSRDGRCASSEDQQKATHDSKGSSGEAVHVEKKHLSILVETSGALDVGLSDKFNGHIGFDCLSAKPGSAGELDVAAMRASPEAATPPPPTSGEEDAAAEDPLGRFPELWRGQAVVKSAWAGVVLRSVKCEQRLARDMLVGDRVTMTQRMRLGEDQMKEFGNRLQSTGEASRGVLLAVPASAEDAPRLRQHFVSYLVERNAAGVARVDAGMLYLFPPGSELAAEYQKSAAIDLSRHPDYLLVILLQDPF
jgi:hypothetical protein